MCFVHLKTSRDNHGGYIETFIGNLYFWFKVFRDRSHIHAVLVIVTNYVFHPCSIGIFIALKTIISSIFTLFY